MKHTTLITAFFGLFILASCSKDDTPETIEPDPSKISFTTGEATDITSTSATIHGSIDLGGQNVTLTSRGVCYSHTNNIPLLPDDPYWIMGNDDLANMEIYLTDLEPSTTYYYRIYGQLDIGLAYGSHTRQFTTLGTGGGSEETDTEDNNQSVTGTMSDIDGNIYKTVKIGEQWWMAENLKVTHYPNGDSIPHIEDNWDWYDIEDSNPRKDAYSYHNGDANSDYGYFYTYDAAIKVAPEGWHLPSKEEYETLINYLGGDGFSSLSGGQLKEIGTNHWLYPNTAATNSTGFTALPAGRRTYGDADYEGEIAYFWTKDKSQWVDQCWFMWVFHDRSYADIQTINRYDGLNVRCIKNR